MKTSRRGGLKQIRVAVSLAVACLITALFLDIWHSIPASVVAAAVSFQIVPSFLKIVATGSLSALIFFAIPVLLTAAIGRFYCSALCPLGFLQDIIIRISHKFNRRKRFRFHPPKYRLQYLLVGIVSAAAAGGSMLLLDCLEPYSLFGRVATIVIQPGAVLLNNIGARILNGMHVYAVHTIQYPWLTTGTAGLTLGLLLLLVMLTAFRGRLFCNLLCPAGAFLSILARRPLMRLRIDTVSCNECGACERVCKAECIESSTKRLEMSACVGCYNCIRSCPHGSIGFAFAYGKPGRIAASQPDSGRRSFLASLGTPAAALILQSLPAAISPKPVKPAEPITPPGSVSRNHYSGTCTACQLCVSVCPTRVLTPSLFHYGLTGVLQPMMNYASGYCNYECTACGEVCPTGAIKSMQTDAKKLIQIGKSTFVREDCIVVSKKKDCAACSEHCPTKAVHTVPYESGLFIPELNNDLCIGCGACEYACPTQPAKAIFVTPNPVHLTAKKPEAGSQPQPFNQMNDFPF